MMSGLLYFAQSCLRILPPEAAHEASLRVLEAGLYLRAKPDDARLRQNIWGLNFPNPVGMAAGYDKNARVPAALLRMGFGFTESGTVTPLPQGGNPAPRVFRLTPERAIINRMGFNNDGHERVLNRLSRLPIAGITGVNVGVNKASLDPPADYVLGLRAFVDVADYFTINISSPNTPGLRDLQAPSRLGGLLERVMGERDALVALGHMRRPVLVKLAPDIHDDDLPAVVECLKAHSVDGIILTNTTIARDAVEHSSHWMESGGLSGGPLFEASTRMLAKVYLLTEGKIPLVGVGGIDSGERAVEKIRAGASLIQLYTGMVYRGSGLLSEVKRALLRAMEKEGAETLGALTGSRAEAWANFEAWANVDAI